jgi:hypothetical protein
VIRPGSRPGTIGEVSEEAAPTPAEHERVAAQDAFFLAAGVAVTVGGVAYRGIVRMTGVAMRTLPHAPEPVSAAVVALAARGREATAAGVVVARGIAEGVARDFTRQPSFVALVNDLVELVLPSAIDRALPVVFDKLAAEPEGVRQVMRAQSTGVAEELVATVRSGAKAGDAVVDRSVRLWRGRRRTATPPVPQLTLEPGAP